MVRSVLDHLSSWVRTNNHADISHGPNKRPIPDCPDDFSSNSTMVKRQEPGGKKGIPDRHWFRTPIRDQQQP